MSVAAKVKKDFPILKRRVRGKQLVYLDNASTTQKPSVVLDSLEQYYKTTNANIHRGVHTLSEEATTAYEDARAKVARFIGAKPEEIVFTRNATEAINLVARTWGMQNIKRGDTILVTEMEHHSNLLPWKWLTEQKGAHLSVIPVTDEGELDLPSLRAPTSVGAWQSRAIQKTRGLLRRAAPRNDTNTMRLLAISHQSNVLGTINPIEKLSQWAHSNGGLILVDGAQSVAHMPIDVKKLGCDFFVFSGHKIGGPTGIGVLWARKELLEHMEPFLYGGDMVKTVKCQMLNVKCQMSATWNDTPYKFEAGTPNIAGAIGLGAAVDYLTKLGMKNVHRHIQEVTRYALTQLSKLPGVRLLGPRAAEKRGGAVAFNVTGIHPHDLATILDRDGIAIRSGHHCAQPLHERFGISASARASFWIYNTKADVDSLMGGIKKAQKIFTGKSLRITNANESTNSGNDRSYSYIRVNS